MWSSRQFPKICGSLLGLVLVVPQSQCPKEPSNTIRWRAGAPNCGFQRGDDGRYRWRMADGDVDMTLIVDSQELTKSRHRLYHPFSVYLTVVYTGHDKFEFPAGLRMQFVRHHNVAEGYLDPDEFSTRMQNDIDTLVFDTEREIKKHPEKAEEKTAHAREYQKEASEFIEFIGTQSLQEAILTPGNPEVHGWVFFSSQNKWIGPWKSREDFILRVKTKDNYWEFPFSLPPAEGDLILRKRDQ